jgi:plastocyanin
MKNNWVDSYFNLKDSKQRSTILHLLALATMVVLSIVAIANSQSLQNAASYNNHSKQDIDIAVETDQIKMLPDGFSPQTIKVKTGAFVTWTNSDSNPHSLKSDSLGNFDSEEPLNPSDQFSYPFEQPGVYRYFDPGNPSYSGTVIVEDDTSPDFE